MKRKEVRPQPGFQEKAIDCPADIAIIGGSAGCGKTFCLLYEPLKYVLDPVPRFNGIIFRREGVQIKSTGGLWDKAKELYSELPERFRPQQLGGNTHFKFLFPTGFELQLAHLHDRDSYYSYQGTEITYIAFDELTHFTEEQFFYLLSRNRSTCKVTPYVRASTNPQGEGWVKRLISWWIYPDDYIIEGLRGAPIPERQGKMMYMARINGDIIMRETPEAVISVLGDFAENFPREAIRSITFVAGKLVDNQVLMKANPGYLGNLMSLTESERAQLYGGRWINLDNDAMMVYSNAAISDLFSNFVPKEANRYITADIALEGSDKFVICIWEGWVLVEIRVFEKTKGDDVLNEIKKAAQDYRVPYRNIAFDATGMGGVYKGFLRTSFAFVSGATPMREKKSGDKEPPQYFNLRSQVFFLLRDIIENSEMLIMDKRYRKEVEEELRAIKKMELKGDMKLRIIPKDQIKQAIGRSPDFADAIAMRVVFDLGTQIAPTKRRVSSF